MNLLMEVASGQHGLVTRAQCLECGVYPGALHRALGRGDLIRVLPDVYRVGGATTSWHQELMAACLWSGDGAVSHASAATMHRLRGYERNAVGPLVITSTKRGLCVPKLKVYRRVPDPRFIGSVAGIPVTNPSLTLMNLAEIEKDPVRYENALDDALRRGLVSPVQLQWGIERLLGPGRRGVGRLARLLGERGPTGGPSASEFQKEVRALLLPEGRFIEEYEVRDERGRLAGIVDFALPPPKVIVEADGLKHHGSRQDFRRDAHRRNRIHGLGWVILSFTPDDLADPEPFLHHLRATTARRTPR